MVPVWKGRRRLRIWSFRRPGGNGMQQASSDAEGAFDVKKISYSYLEKEKA